MRIGTKIDPKDQRQEEMKKSLTIIIVIFLLLIGGYYLYYKTTHKPDESLPVECDGNLYDDNGLALHPEQVEDCFSIIENTPIEASSTVFRITKKNDSKIIIDLKDILKPQPYVGDEDFDPNGRWSSLGNFIYVKLSEKFFFTIYVPDLSGNAFQFITLYSLDVNTGKYHAVTNVENSMDIKLSPDEKYIQYWVGVRLYPGGRTWVELIDLVTEEKIVIDPEPDIFDYKKDNNLTDENEVSEYIDIESWINDNLIKIKQEIIINKKDQSSKSVIKSIWQYNVETKEYKLISKE